MNALEAMQRLVSLADKFRHAVGYRGELEEDQLDETAVAVIQRMLNTALPVTRYRVFVELDQVQPRAKLTGVKQSPVTEEFIVSGVTIRAVLGGLIGLHEAPLDVRVTLWEQRATGAEMISGYQGRTKTKGYRAWLGQIAALDERKKATVQ